MDVALALGFLVCALLLGEQRPSEGYPPLSAWGYVLTCLINLPIAVRRRRPVAVCAVICLLWAAYVGAGFWPAVNSLAPLMAIYTVASMRPLRTAAGCAALVAGVWIFGGVVSPRGSMPAVVAQAAVFPSVLVRFGARARQSAERGERLAELTAQLRREQDEKARRAVADEQARIARELHDVIAHHMSVIAVQSGLARYVFRTDPATAADSLAVIEDTSSEALEEMRRMLTLLRSGVIGSASGDEPYTPMPALDGLGEVVERVRAGGVPVELSVRGEVRPLPPGIELCAYRIVQEALTNVLKHARPASAQVSVLYLPHQLQVSITDDGVGAVSATPVDERVTGTGHGLIGMRERAKLYGGTVAVGPRPEGGFGVRLTLPTSAMAAGNEGQ
ncbi:sensor histidine kinase [Streptomyces sp. A7024]|uniref:histidine kinase n=1 Tax=Streptomyces coryli TaxID=1128680 RepID=A0A6G4TV91_9ACTN|nr:sensor histidine kinase [Streptomyces coryli]